MPRICSMCKQPNVFTPSEEKRKWRGGYCAPCKTKYNREWRSKNPEKHREARRRWYQAKRAAVIEHYGGRCVCCGESEPAFLALDHINGDGNKDRNEHGTRSWYLVARRGYPVTFQLLCHNCNMAKSWLKVCPHQSGATE